MRQLKEKKWSITGNQRGAVAALVAVLFIVLVGMVAFALDINHLYVVNNELQNAADAGALAGAAVLFEDPDDEDPEVAGLAINTGANQVAYDVAIANLSEKTAVDVHWTSGNDGDVQRGHWSFVTRTFTPNASEVPTALWLKSNAELDADTDFINAVRVIVRREDTPAESFFAGIFGRDNFTLQAEAVAYLGFAGSMEPGEADQPILICEGSILNDDNQYSCNVGRMVNSSDDGVTSNTAAWGSMELDLGSCNGTSASEISPKICRDGGANDVSFSDGDPLESINGQVDTLFASLEDCWLAAVDDDGDAIPEHPYRMNLPVVRCGDGSTGNCPDFAGAVTVNLMLLTGTNTNKPEDVVPTSMTDAEWESGTDWDASTSCDETIYVNGELVEFNYNSLVGMKALDALPLLPDPDGVDRWKIDDRWKANPATIYEQAMANWDCFVDHFNMKNSDTHMAPLANDSMYFMPDCSPHEAKGRTGGSNYGVRAKYPVLVD